MSLVSYLSESRETMNANLITNFVEGFIPKVESHVLADMTSRHIEVRLEFAPNGKEAVLKLNDKAVDTFDISNLLGNLEEKFFEILIALQTEGFENKSKLKEEYWNDDKVEFEVYAIGFDI